MFDEKHSEGRVKRESRPIKTLYIGFILCFLMIIQISSAETVKLLENTDICQYKPKLDMDYCYSKYEICDLSLSDVEKSTFLFKDEKNDYKYDIKSVYSNDISIVDKGLCKELTITAYKSPYKNVDNVLCTIEKCYYEYAWWNRSFAFKYPINATTSSGEVTMMVLLNDSSVTINNNTQYIWCNYTVNTTRSVVGYLYFTNESFYRCVDRTETFPVVMIIDQGNETPFGVPEENLSAWLPLDCIGTDCPDVSRYINNGTTVNSPTEIPGKIGNAQSFDSGSSEYITIPFSHPTTTWTVNGWFRIDFVFAGEGHLWTFGNNAGHVMQFFKVGNSDWLQYGEFNGVYSSITSAGIPTDGETWVMATVVKNGAAATIYINGVTNSSGTVDRPVANLANIGIGASLDGSPASFYNGTVDNFMIWNRTLSADEILALYENQVDGLDFAPLEPVEVFEDTTSILGASFNISDFVFADTSFVTVFNATFEPTEAVDLVLLSSMNIEKISGGGSNIVSIRISIDGTPILTESLRTVTGIGDIGSVSVSPTLFNATAGQHNISYEFRRTGGGAIGVSNIDAILFQNVTNTGGSVRVNITPVSYSHSSTSFIPAFNWTIIKSALSNTYYTIKQTVSKLTSGDSIVTYFFEDLTENHTSPFWQRIISGASDIGSVAGVFIDLPEIGSLNYTIQSRQSDAGDTVSVNGSILDIDMIDSNITNVSTFQTTNPGTNLTRSLNLTAGTHNIANATVTFRDGDAYFLSVSTSFGTNSGEQTPEYSISSNSTTSCTSLKERYLSDASDIGNVMIYMLCENLTVGIDYIFYLNVTVQGGEILRQLDESFNGFEVKLFDLVILQLPPIASAITNPENGSNVTGSDLITWLPFFDPNGDVVTYNVTLLNVDGTHNSTIDTTASTSLAVDWNIFTSTTYFLQVEGCDPGDLCDDTNITITIIDLPTPQLEPSITFCEDANILRSSVNSRTITNGNVTDELIITRTNCNYGCSNWTISTLGNPGCEEGDFWLSIAFIITLIVLVLIIRGAAK